MIDYIRRVLGRTARALPGNVVGLMAERERRLLELIERRTRSLEGMSRSVAEIREVLERQAGDHGKVPREDG